MDLQNGNITVNQILRNPAAKNLLYQEIPQFMNPMMLSMGRNMTLNQVVKHARGRLSQQKINHLLTQLGQV